MIFNLKVKEVLGVIESDSTKLVGSYDSVLKINKICGVCEQGENSTPTNYQEIKKSVISGVKTHGNNFINQLCVPITYLDVKKYFLKAGTYTASRDTSENNNNWYIGAYDNSGNVITKSAVVIQDYVLNSTNEYKYGGAPYRHMTFTINVDCYVKIGSLNGSGKTYLMLNEGSTPLPYEPYTESSITLSQPIELYGVGDIHDTIEGDKVNRKYGVVVLDGSADETFDLSASEGGGYYFVYTNNNLPILKDSSKKHGLLCTRLIERTTDYMWRYDVDGISTNHTSAHVLRMRFTSIPSITDVKSLKAKLAEWYAEGKPMVIAYPLDEPVIEELPKEDQIALNNLQTFNSVTYVEFDSEVQPTLNCDYATSPVGAVALSVHAYNEIEKSFVTYNHEDGSVNFNGTIRSNAYIRGQNLQADQIVHAESVHTWKDMISDSNITAENNITAKNELRAKDLHITNMGVAGGASQPVEWVFDEVLKRWVLCTIT